MKTKLTTLIMCIVLAWNGTTHLQAQVTVGSNKKPESYSTLEVDGQQGGVRLPQLNATERATLQAKFNSNPTGSIGLTIYNTTDKEVQYWDGTQWVSAKASEEPWRVSESTIEATANNQNIYQKGQVTIGTDTIDATAAFNVDATNKGVLFPRITLTGSTDKATIPNPTTGLLVYNTGANPNFSTTGYMFWDGTAWKLFNSSSSEAASAILNCSGAGMSPAQQVLGGTAIIAGTVLQIPYSGSNGGSFNGATLVSTGNSNVTATIAGSMLSVGNGVLNFTLSGMPEIAQQAPNGIKFDLTPFLDNNPGITGCDEVVVGKILTASIEETATMGYFMLTTDNTGNDTGTQYYALQCDSPDGKFSIRAEVPVTQTSVAYGNQYLNIQVRNNQNIAVPVIFNYGTDYAAVFSRSGVLTIPPQRWGGDQDSHSTWTNATGNNTSNGAYWGQVGIYDATGNGPEYRRYTWIPQGENSKVSYEATIMVAIDTTTPLVAVHPTKIKCYIKFSQVTAQ